MDTRYLAMRLERLKTGAAALMMVTQTFGATEGDSSPWAEWIEPDFPFFSSVLDCREVGDGSLRDNLVPRGVILSLGHQVWACYDLDLLRIACVWEGVPGMPPVTAEALAPGSYHVAGQKTKDGQEHLPKPVGKVLAVNGVYPGWQSGESPVFDDPRGPAPSLEEVGRGALPTGMARLRALTLSDDGPEFELVVGETLIRTRLRVESERGGLVLVERSEIHPNAQELHLLHPGLPRSGLGSPAGVRSSSSRSVRGEEAPAWGAQHVVEPSDKRREFEAKTPLQVEAVEREVAIRTRLWGQVVTTRAELGPAGASEAYAVDKIPLPVPNPWKRNVRLADIDFLDDRGNAVGVTIDGDVWRISGLKGDLEKVTWRRFASGLHEPMSVVVRDGEPYVFDRAGIWRLEDANGDGECDRYEMFCNLFAQTAETREFPMSMKLGPGGGFVISKGGQQGTTLGKHNGTAIRVGSDGKSFDVIGYGLRQPFIGVNPVTGLVTASDQQGHYVPSTPIHILRDHQFYGFLPGMLEEEAYPAVIAEPLVWIPHPVNPSGATQVWAMDERFGPAAGDLIHVGYNRPELFRVVMSPRFRRPQAAVMSFTRDLDFGPLNAKVNPADGQLYVAGFQIWGTTAKELSGLARVRYQGGDRPLVKEVTPMDKGVLLTFNTQLDPKTATDPENYSAERWNYRRTPKYGSPHLKLDGSSGQEWMTASSAYLSDDGRKVMVGFPDMRGGVDQMRIGWGVETRSGAKAQSAAYFTPWELEEFEGEAEGFGAIEVDLKERVAVAAVERVVSAEEGEKLYQMFGCMACHSTDGTLQGKVGPSWRGLYGSKRELSKEGTVTADETYLEESILNPSAKVVKGFEKFDSGMPIYEGILNEAQVDSLVLFIKSLQFREAGQ